MSAEITEWVDASGLKCPEPIMMLHAAIRRIRAGSTVCLIATDPSTERDVANFCRFLEHTLIETRMSGERFEFTIRKADRKAES